MTLTKLLAALSCLVFAIAAPAAAQSLRVNIPFDFQSGNSSLSAGTYLVAVDAAKHHVLLTGAAGESVYAMFLFNTVPLDVRERPELVFHKYGARHFLREVATSSHSVTLPASKEETFVKRAAADHRGPQMALVRVTLQ